MKDFTRVINPGTVNIGDRYVDLFIIIMFERGKLSISGVEGPYKNGNCAGSCGQLVMNLKLSDMRLNDDWTGKMFTRLLEVWDRWHLNNMQAGTPAQMKELRRRESLIDDPLCKEAPHAYAYQMKYKSCYDMHREWLKDANLLYDNGYEFGTKWLKEDVPEDVLEFLYKLPRTKITPAWV